MKTAILCGLFLVIGVALGAFATAYLAKRSHERQVAILFASNVGLDALRAQQIKSGETEFVLSSIENGLPDQLLFLRENEIFKQTIVADGALKAVKRFYVCTNTPVPGNVASMLADIELGAGECLPTLDR